MKYLYFGTICEQENYYRIRKNFKVMPSVAPFVFEGALLEGFCKNGADVDVVSFPVIPMFPKSRHLAWGNRREKLATGYETTWIGTVNLPGLKQLGQRVSSYVLLKNWLQKNAEEEKAVIIYSAYQPVSKSIVSLCQKYKTKCYAIIPDLPRDMYSLGNLGPVKKQLSKLYVRAAEKVQGKFSGYVYLTEAMKDVINPTAPYTVVEGVADAHGAVPAELAEKAPEKVVMYAGALREKYGLKNLIEAFMSTKDETFRLWLFGNGDFREQVIRYAEADSRICYFGNVDRRCVLENEKKASVLVNVRNSNDTYTKYSFPSKIIEYMLSGTPLLTTKLAGIPEEYSEYAYFVDNNDVTTLAEALERICAQPQETLIAFGNAAQKFIAQEKNSCVQARKIMELIHRTGM